MELNQASKIANDWGIHLEYFQGKLTFIFGGTIPESLLPYPIEILEEALNMMAKYHHDMGNQDGYSAMQSSVGWLTAYKNDAEALIKAANNFTNSKWQEAMLPALKKFQDSWATDRQNLSK